MVEGGESQDSGEFFWGLCLPLAFPNLTARAISSAGNPRLKAPIMWDNSCLPTPSPECLLHTVRAPSTRVRTDSEPTRSHAPHLMRKVRMKPLQAEQHGRSIRRLSGTHLFPACFVPVFPTSWPWESSPHPVMPTRPQSKSEILQTGAIATLPRWPFLRRLALNDEL